MKHEQQDLNAVGSCSAWVCLWCQRIGCGQWRCCAWLSISDGKDGTGLWGVLPEGCRLSQSLGTLDRLWWMRDGMSFLSYCKEWVMKMSMLSRLSRNHSKYFRIKTSVFNFALLFAGAGSISTQRYISLYEVALCLTGTDSDNWRRFDWKLVVLPTVLRATPQPTLLWAWHTAAAGWLVSVLHVGSWQARGMSDWWKFWLQE